MVCLILILEISCVQSPKPKAPSISITSSPANNNSPVLSGSTESNYRISVFTNGTCSGSPTVLATAGADGSFQVTVSVADDSSTVFSVLATDLAGHTGKCSSQANYTEDSSSTTPTSLGISPFTSGYNTSVTITGSAERNASVSIYADAACGTAAVATATANSSGSFSASGAATTKGATDTYYARGVDTLGNVSLCSPTSVSYTRLPLEKLSTARTYVNGHTCSIDATTAGLRCWGYNLTGAIGDGTTTDQGTATNVSGLGSGVEGVATGDRFSCAVLTTGGVKCWGYNGFGQLGDGSTTDRHTPVDVSGITNAIQVVAGGDHACALLNDNTVKCWGINTYGELGDGSTTNSSTPVTVSGLSNAMYISAGMTFTCALMLNATVKCWGDNNNGSIGDGSTTNRSTPTIVTGLTNVWKLSSGGYHTCVVTTTATVKCWGANDFGELGDGTVVDKTTAFTFPGVASAAQVSVGIWGTCILYATGALECIGFNSSAQLGDGSTTNRTSLTAVSGLGSGVSFVTKGTAVTCASLTAGGVKCWGYGTHGEIGDGNFIQRNVPTDVVGL